MADKRMFTKKIIDSDSFLDMPLSAQALYFHLNMRADDDGFLNNAKRIMRIVGANQNDYDLLLAKRFIIQFPDGICVIKHWRMHNYIKKDRYRETQYKEEKKFLGVKKNGAYTLSKEKAVVMLGQGRNTNGDISGTDRSTNVDDVETGWSTNGTSLGTEWSTVGDSSEPDWNTVGTALDTDSPILEPNRSTNGAQLEPQVRDRVRDRLELDKDIVDTSVPTAPKYPANSFEMLCVETLIHSCLENFPKSRVPKTDAQKDKWADEIRKMKNLDKLTEQEIKDALAYAVKDGFWQSNIRSTKKFREKFETLYTQAHAENKRPGVQSIGDTEDRFSRLAAEYKEDDHEIRRI